MYIEQGIEVEAEVEVEIEVSEVQVLEKNKILVRCYASKKDMAEVTQLGQPNRCVRREIRYAHRKHMSGI
jgi:hypothetical protein